MRRSHAKRIPPSKKYFAQDFLKREERNKINLLEFWISSANLQRKATAVLLNAWSSLRTRWFLWPVGWLFF
jgi:hypothetical protein